MKHPLLPKRKMPININSIDYWKKMQPPKQTIKLTHLITYLVAIISFICIITTAHAQNLLQITKLAIKHDHTYLQAIAQNQSSQLQYEVDKGKIYPKISATPTFQYSLTGESSEITNGISLGFTHTFQFSNYKQLTVDEYKSLAAQVSSISSFQDVLSRVSIAYFTVTKDQATLSLLKKRLATAQKILAVVKQKYQGGATTHTDVLNAQAQLNTTKVNIIGQRNTIKQDQSKLQVIIGTMPIQLATLKTNYPFKQPLPLDSKQILALATSRNPQVIAAHFTSLQSLATVHEVKSTHWPSLDASVSYSESSISSAALGAGNTVLGGAGTNADFSLNIPITQPGFSASVKQALKNYDQSLEEYKLALAKTTDSLREAYQYLYSDHQKLNKLAKVIEADQHALTNTLHAYEGGLEDLTAVFYAQNTVYMNKQQNIDTKFDYITNQINLETAMGTLDLTQIVRINHWLN